MLPTKPNHSPVASRSSGLKKETILALNSTAFYVLAYLFVHFAHQLATVLTARAAGIHTRLYPGHIYFKISDSQWQANDVITVYAAGPLAALVLGLLGFAGFKLAVKYRNNLKIFLLWVFIFGLNMAFGSLLAGCVVQGGFWYAVKWSVYNFGVVWGIAGLLGLALILAGFFMAPAFPDACPSATLKQFRNRRKMLTAMLVYPWLFGNLVLAIIKFPDLIVYEGLQFFTLLLFLVPAYSQNLRDPLEPKIYGAQKTRLSVAAIALSVLAAVVFRVWLQKGMVFG
jgi:hypothetical protein